MTNPIATPIKPADVKVGQKFGQSHVTKVTAKRVTVYFPLSAKSFDFTWNGEGFARQGQFLRIDGSIK